MNFGGTSPLSYSYADRQYKRHYAAQNRITRQAKVKQTSGSQTVKTHIKSFFAFYTCFRTSILQIQFRILYVVRFRTFAFSYFAFYTCPQPMSNIPPLMLFSVPTDGQLVALVLFSIHYIASHVTESREIRPGTIFKLFSCDC